MCLTPAHVYAEFPNGTTLFRLAYTEHNLGRDSVFGAVREESDDAMLLWRNTLQLDGALLHEDPARPFLPGAPLL